MSYQDNVREGMPVFSSDGKKLGKVVQRQPGWFLIEKGIFFKKDYSCAYDLISNIDDEGIHLNAASDSITEGGMGAEVEARQGFASREERQGEMRATSEMRVPLAEEELEAGKRTYQAGEVRIHKDVATETKQVSVPLHHEEVRVERVAAPGGRELKPGEPGFEKSTTTIPVYEEEAEIRKRPVVREELRVSKEGFTEERRATEAVRRETADVEKSGELRRGDKPHGSE